MLVHLSLFCILLGTAFAYEKGDTVYYVVSDEGGQHGKKATIIQVNGGSFLNSKTYDLDFGNGVENLTKVKKKDIMPVYEEHDDVQWGFIRSYGRVCQIKDGNPNFANKTYAINRRKITER